MYTHPHNFYNTQQKFMNETAATWISREECNYLANVNYKLVVNFVRNRMKSIRRKQKNISIRPN